MKIVAQFLSIEDGSRSQPFTADFQLLKEEMEQSLRDNPEFGEKTALIILHEERDNEWIISGCPFMLLNTIVNLGEIRHA